MTETHKHTPDDTYHCTSCGAFDSAAALMRILDLEQRVLELSQRIKGPDGATAYHLQRLVDEGWTLQELSELTGYSRKTVSQFVVVAAPGITPVVRQKLRIAEEALNDGMSCVAAAEISGLAPETVYQRFPGRSWTPQEVGAYSTALQKMERVTA